MPDLTLLRVFDDLDGFAIPIRHQVPSGTFRRVKQLVGLDELPLGFSRAAGSVLRFVHQPDADRHPQPRPHVRPRMMRDARAGVLGDPDRRAGVHVGQHQRELLAAVPGGEAAGGTAFLQQVSDPPEHVVSDDVSEGVVHLLEEVQVDQCDRDAGGATPLGEQAVQALIEVAAVVAGRQRVTQATGAGEVEGGPKVLVGAPVVALGGKQAGDGFME
jgi:hypothetical protein